MPEIETGKAGNQTPAFFTQEGAARIRTVVEFNEKLYKNQLPQAGKTDYAGGGFWAILDEHREGKYSWVAQKWDDAAQLWLSDLDFYGSHDDDTGYAREVHGSWNALLKERIILVPAVTEDFYWCEQQGGMLGLTVGAIPANSSGSVAPYTNKVRVANGDPDIHPGFRTIRALNWSGTAINAGVKVQAKYFGGTWVIDWQECGT